MAYTKEIPKFDKITIDGTDVSACFREFGRTSEDTLEDVSGFSATGNDEFLQGSRTQRFVGDAFYAEELLAIIEPIHDDRDTCVITYQPGGLVDATREIFTGTCTIPRLETRRTRGSIATFPFEAVPDANGINVSNWT